MHPLELAAAFHAHGCIRAYCLAETCQRDHTIATRRAADMVQKLGSCWRPLLSQNLGWHPYAVAARGRIRVSPNLHGPTRRIVGYSADILDEGSHPGILFTGHGRTPGAAAIAARVQLRDAAEKLSRLDRAIRPDLAWSLRDR